MERRYGRAYRLSTDKKKLPSKRTMTVKWRSIICLLLLVAGIITSFTANKKVCQKIEVILYKVNTVDDWKDEFAPAAKTVKRTASAMTKKWNRVVASAFKKAGINNTSAQTNAKAKEQKKLNNDIRNNKLGSKSVKNPENDDSEASDPVFLPPTEGEISSVYGIRLHPINGQNVMHTGIDIAAPHGQTVVASCPGTVEKTGTDLVNGSYVVVRHSDTLMTVYAHMSKICVSQGETVDHGIKIGEVGSTGVSTGPHLHFEVKVNSQSVNPENYITIVHRAGV